MNLEATRNPKPLVYPKKKLVAAHLNSGENLANFSFQFHDSDNRRLNLLLTRLHSFTSSSSSSLLPSSSLGIIHCPHYLPPFPSFTPSFFYQNMLSSHYHPHHTMPQSLPRYKFQDKKFLPSTENVEKKYTRFYKSTCVSLFSSFSSSFSTTSVSSSTSTSSSSQFRIKSLK